MLTVFDITTAYCSKNNLPPPSKKDLTNIGRIVGTHFRRFWGIRNPDHIKEAGFVLSPEDGYPSLVIGYPDVFIDEMLEGIKYFYTGKSERLGAAKKMEKVDEKPICEPRKEETETVKKRTRKPVQKPAFSLKK